MLLLRVAYGAPTDPHRVHLRSWAYDGGFLKGIACDEFGIADREGCADAELWIAERRILEATPVERKVSV